MAEITRLFKDETTNTYLYPFDGVPEELASWQLHHPSTPRFPMHSQTSMEASISILPKQNSLKMKVLALIREHPEGLTDELIALKLDLNPSTARPRRIELAEMGLIESHGTAPTTSGRKAQLWRATPTIEAS